MAEVVPAAASGQTSPVTGGASVEPVYTRRKMRMHAIAESEIATISVMNAQATIYFSLSSFFGSSAVAIYTNAVFYTELTPAGQVARGIAAPGLILLTIAFLILGIIMIRARGAIWGSVRKESRMEGPADADVSGDEGG